MIKYSNIILISSNITSLMRIIELYATITLIVVLNDAENVACEIKLATQL